MTGYGVTNFTFNPGGTLNLSIDANQDTTFGQPGNGNQAWIAANTVDDVLIATGAIINGSGVLDTTLGRKGVSTHKCYSACSL